MLHHVKTQDDDLYVEDDVVRRACLKNAKEMKAYFASKGACRVRSPVDCRFHGFHGFHGAIVLIAKPVFSAF